MIIKYAEKLDVKPRRKSCKFAEASRANHAKLEEDDLLLWIYNSYPP